MQRYAAVAVALWHWPAWVEWSRFPGQPSRLIRVRNTRGPRGEVGANLEQAAPAWSGRRAILESAFTSRDKDQGARILGRRARVVQRGG